MEVQQRPRKRLVLDYVVVPRMPDDLARLVGYTSSSSLVDTSHQGVHPPKLGLKTNAELDDATSSNKVEETYTRDRLPSSGDAAQISNNPTADEPHSLDLSHPESTQLRSELDPLFDTAISVPESPSPCIPELPPWSSMESITLDTSSAMVENPNLHYASAEPDHPQPNSVPDISINGVNPALLSLDTVDQVPAESPKAQLQQASLKASNPKPILTNRKKSPSTRIPSSKQSEAKRGQAKSRLEKRATSDEVWESLRFGMTLWDNSTGQYMGKYMAPTDTGHSQESGRDTSPTPSRSNITPSRTIRGDEVKSQPKKRWNQKQDMAEVESRRASTSTIPRHGTTTENDDTIPLTYPSITSLHNIHYQYNPSRLFSPDDVKNIENFTHAINWLYMEEDSSFCHQCRRTTTIDKMRCYNVKRNGDRCPAAFCHRCIIKRFV